MLGFLKGRLFSIVISLVANQLDDLLALGFNQLLKLYKRERKDVVAVIGKAIRKTPLARRATPEELEAFASAWEAFVEKYSDTKEYKAFEKAATALIEL